MADIFINEIHYDNAGSDAGEFIEIAGPAGTDLTGWQIVLYNGNGGAAYNTETLSGTISDEGNGFGTVVVTYPSNGIQNGGPDGVALVDNTGAVVQFLSYEGSFTAVGGAADGLTSIDIGISESSTTPVGASLALTGTGTVSDDFTWAVATTNSAGTINTDQTFGGSTPTVNAFISEFHYDNVGGDEGEFIEVTADAGADLTGYTLVLYNGNGGTTYNTLSLSGMVVDQSNGQGTLVVDLPANGLQNGSPDGIALVDADGNVVEFISYEGELTATDGPAAGLTSTDVGVAEGGDTPVGDSLQFIDGVWTGPATASKGEVNAADNGGGGDEPILATIAEIQGSGFESSLVGQTVATSGIVTKLLTNGFYLQTPDGLDDGNAATSEGVFVFTGAAPTVAVGDGLDLAGDVSEFFGLTQLSDADITVVSSGNSLPAAVQISLASLEQTDLEAYEGMRFELVSSGAEPLVIIENFNFDRFGEITVAEGNQTQPTQILDPDTQVAAIQTLTDKNTNERLLLDDGNGSQNPDEFPYVPANVGDNSNGFLDAGDTFSAAGPTVRLGAEVSDVNGVLSFGFSEYRLLVDDTITIDQATNEGARPADAPEVGGDISVASFNVLNYFTTLDVSGAGTGPDGSLNPRGADNQGELDRQTAKLVAALAELDADVVGLQEIENNGTVAISTLVNELNAVVGAGTYTFVDPTGTGDFIGTDAITTGLIYKPSAVSVVASDVLVFEERSATTTFALADVLNQVASSDDQVGDFQRNRPAVAATFQDADGEQFTVAVNHFKSKGDSNLEDVVLDAQAALDGGNTTITQADIDALIADPNYNQGDGQGFWNQVRADAGAELAAWLTDSSATGYAGGAIADPDYLVIGDLNAYAKEDPLDAVKSGGFTDLIDALAPGGQAAAYSFVFDGQRGSLDHALSTSALTDQVTGVAEWHINADEPDLLNYDDSFNNSAFFDDNLFGASDHDPLLIGLNLDSATPGEEITGTRRRDVLIGTNGNDVIRGLGGRDTILGSAGDDILIGGPGQDTLTGGLGKDTFVYEKTIDRVDRITDFEVGADVLDFSALFTDLRRYGSATPFDDYIRVRGHGPTARVQVDLNGDFGRRDRFRTFALLENTAASSITEDSFIV